MVISLIGLLCYFNNYAKCDIINCKGVMYLTKLREARDKAGLRRDFVADKLSITGDHLNLIERGKVNLKLTQIEALANLYKVNFEEMARIALETFERREINGGIINARGRIDGQAR